MMIGLLGIMAFYLTLFQPDNEFAKAGWAISFVVITCGIIFLNVYQKKEEKKANTDMNAHNLKLQGQVETLTQKLSEFMSNPIEEKIISAIIEKVESKSREHPPTPDSLKQRLQNLSTSILRFLLDRRDSPLPRPETWDNDIDRMLRLSAETRNLYSLSFGAQVIAARNELLKHGIIDKELDTYYEHPTNPIVMRIIGERLGALAESLPN
ncbi:hypothetical protein EPN95_04470 [Patescibacteria group bacterium]|nr:MAG: hypothetical protein EPN95_04470 [Patescibacteria group bacterium]